VTIFTPLSGAASVGAQIFLEQRSMLRIVARQSVGDVARHDLAVERVEVVVRIALGMNVAFGAIDGARHVEHRDAGRSVDIARLPRHDLGVVRGFEKRRQPRNFHIEAHVNQQRGAVEPRHEARLHRHRVHELDAARQAFDVDQLLADLLGHIGELRRGRHDADRLGAAGGCDTEQHADERRKQQKFCGNFHGQNPPHRLRKPWLWLPRVVVHCRKN
jgi:hypothetical protein